MGNSWTRNDRPGLPLRPPTRLLAGWAAGLIAAILLAFAAVPASAAVELTFYSKDLGSSFPHAFVTMHGSLDRTGRKVDADFGFSAKSISPAILFGAVTGEVISDHGAAYIRGSDKHFSLTLGDAEYDQVMATIERWRKLAQPSYELNRRNCVHFVGEIAAALGMKVDTTRLMKKPRSFLEALSAANHSWLLAHAAHIYRGEASAGGAPRKAQP